MASCTGGLLGPLTPSLPDTAHGAALPAQPAPSVGAGAGAGAGAGCGAARDDDVSTLASDQGRTTLHQFVTRALLTVPCGPWMLYSTPPAPPGVRMDSVATPLLHVYACKAEDLSHADQARVDDIVALATKVSRPLKTLSNAYDIPSMHSASRQRIMRHIESRMGPVPPSKVCTWDARTTAQPRQRQTNLAHALRVEQRRRQCPEQDLPAALSGGVPLDLFSRMFRGELWCAHLWNELVTKERKAHAQRLHRFPRYREILATRWEAAGTPLVRREHGLDLDMLWKLCTQARLLPLRFRGATPGLQTILCWVWLRAWLCKCMHAELQSGITALEKLARAIETLNEDPRDADAPCIRLLRDVLYEFLGPNWQQCLREDQVDSVLESINEPFVFRADMGKTIFDQVYATMKNIFSMHTLPLRARTGSIASVLSMLHDPGQIHKTIMFCATLILCYDNNNVHGAAWFRRTLHDTLNANGRAWSKEIRTWASVADVVLDNGKQDEAILEDDWTTASALTLPGVQQALHFVTTAIPSDVASEPQRGSRSAAAAAAGSMPNPPQPSVDAARASSMAPLRPEPVPAVGPVMGSVLHEAQEPALTPDGKPQLTDAFLRLHAKQFADSCDDAPPDKRSVSVLDSSAGADDTHKRIVVRSTGSHGSVGEPDSGRDNSVEEQYDEVDAVAQRVPIVSKSEFMEMHPWVRRLHRAAVLLPAHITVAIFGSLSGFTAPARKSCNIGTVLKEGFSDDDLSRVLFASGEAPVSLTGSVSSPNLLQNIHNNLNAHLRAVVSVDKQGLELVSISDLFHVCGTTYPLGVEQGCLRILSIPKVLHGHVMAQYMEVEDRLRTDEYVPTTDMYGGVLHRQLRGDKSNIPKMIEFDVPWTQFPDAKIAVRVDKFVNWVFRLQNTGGAATTPARSSRASAALPAAPAPRSKPTGDTSGHIVFTKHGVQRQPLFDMFGRLIPEDELCSDSESGSGSDTGSDSGADPAARRGKKKKRAISTPTRGTSKWGATPQSDNAPLWFDMAAEQPPGAGRRDQIGADSVAYKAPPFTADSGCLSDSGIDTPTGGFERGSNKCNVDPKSAALVATILRLRDELLAMVRIHAWYHKHFGPYDPEGVANTHMGAFQNIVEGKLAKGTPGKLAEQQRAMTEVANSAIFRDATMRGKDIITPDRIVHDLVLHFFKMHGVRYVQEDVTNYKKKKNAEARKAARRRSVLGNALHELGYPETSALEQDRVPVTCNRNTLRNLATAYVNRIMHMVPRRPNTKRKGSRRRGSGAGTKSTATSRRRYANRDRDMGSISNQTWNNIMLNSFGRVVGGMGKFHLYIYMFAFPREESVWFKNACDIAVNRFEVTVNAVPEDVLEAHYAGNHRRGRARAPSVRGDAQVVVHDAHTGTDRTVGRLDGLFAERPHKKTTKVVTSGTTTTLLSGAPVIKNARAARRSDVVGGAPKPQHEAAPARSALKRPPSTARHKRPRSAEQPPPQSPRAAAPSTKRARVRFHTPGESPEITTNKFGAPGMTPEENKAAFLALWEERGVRARPLARLRTLADSFDWLNWSRNKQKHLVLADPPGTTPKNRVARKARQTIFAMHAVTACRSSAKCMHPHHTKAVK